jgi:uncharacterized Zn finger protein
MNQRSPEDGQNWARRWRSWLRGLGLAGGERSGSRVKWLEVLRGRVVAQVQDRSGQRCDVEIDFTPWTDEEWQRVVDVLGSQAIFAARLLAGDLPAELDRMLSNAGVQLLPERVSSMARHCSCQTEAGKLCEHMAAVYAGLGELLPEDPWLLFRLRGRDQQELLRSLRAQRSRTDAAPPAPVNGKGGAGRGGESGFYRAGGREEESAALVDQVDGFWGSAKAQQDFRAHIVPAAVELALLRRLGPPPVGAAGSETYEALIHLYRRISQTALDVAYAVDAPEGGEAGEIATETATEIATETTAETAD